MGRLLIRQKCISIKRDVLNSQKDFHQLIRTELELSGYSSGVIRCDFVKTVSRKNRTVDYKAYLLVKRLSGEYFIIGESDSSTDRNIKNRPDLGNRVAIRSATRDELYATQKREGGIHLSQLALNGDMLIAFGSVAIGVAGLLIVFRRVRNSRAPRIPLRKQPKAADYAKGLEFEKFIVQQFDIYNGFFTLLEWRGDKFHRGIYPTSSRNPDLEYEYRYKDYVRKFAVECKYRSKAFNGSVQIMDEDNYRTYQAFNRNHMPVYIALGIGGEPSDPVELYLIPFDEAELEMPVSKLSGYRKGRKIFYDMNADRLT